MVCSFERNAIVSFIMELSYIFWCEKLRGLLSSLVIKRSTTDALTIISDVIKVKAIQCFPTGDFFSYFKLASSKPQISAKSMLEEEEARCCKQNICILLEKSSDVPILSSPDAQQLLQQFLLK